MPLYIHTSNIPWGIGTGCHQDVARIRSTQQDCESGAKVLREHKGVTRKLVIKDDK